MTKFKVGDNVRIITGKDAGKQGVVLSAQKAVKTKKAKKPVDKKINTEAVERNEYFPYDYRRNEKSFVSDKILIAKAQTQFFTAIGIKDVRLRNLVAGVVKAIIEGDHAKLNRIHVVLHGEQVPSAITLPEKAPEMYRDRPLHHETGERENLEQFLTRVYKKEIAAGVLTEPALSRLDKTAYNLLRATKASFPGLKIPSKQELMVQDRPDPAALRAVQRLAKRSYRERLAARTGNEAQLTEK